MPCVAYGYFTTQQAHHCRNNHGHHTAFLLALASQTNQGHITASMNLHTVYHHTPLGFYSN